MDIARKAACYDIQSAAVDGMDVLAVEAVAAQAAAAVRSSWKPFFLECRTYRFRAHSMYDPELYRAKTEVEEWKKRCPIETFIRKMKNDQILGDADVQAIQDEVSREIGQAVAFAEAGVWEPLDDLTRFVYSQGGRHDQRRQQPAKMHVS
jgi:TPP-dependent pyruvate/acetoin dehydrogenase alpha subunit